MIYLLSYFRELDPTVSLKSQALLGIFCIPTGKFIKNL
jgi:hypothetical protein